MIISFSISNLRIEFLKFTYVVQLAAVTLIGFIAKTAAGALLPKSARWQDRVTFIWLVSVYGTCKAAGDKTQLTTVFKRHLMQ